MSYLSTCLFPCVLGLALLAPSVHAQQWNSALEVGNDSVLLIPQHPSLEPVTAMTVECWVKAQGSISHGRIIRKSGDFEPGYHLNYSFSGSRVGTDFYSQGSTYVLSDTQSNSTYLNSWHHLAVTVAAGGEMNFYVDGALASTRSAPAVIQHSEAMTIGGFLINPGNIHEEFIGLVDEVRFWNVERSAVDIAESFDQYISDGPGLVSLWHFDGDTLDSKGSNHGQLIGSARLVNTESPLNLTFDISRSTGSWSGGTTIDLRGYFPNGIAPQAIYFGTEPSPSFQLIDPKLVRAVVPPGSAGKDVEIRGEYQSFTMTSEEPFTYLPRIVAPTHVRTGRTAQIRMEVPPPGWIVLFAGLPPEISIELPPFAGALAVTPPFVELIATPLFFSAAEISFGIPDDPSLIGLEVLFQSLFASGTGLAQGSFSNATTMVIDP